MNYYYLDISLEFLQNRNNHVSSAAFFKKHISQCLNKLFGESAASTTIDILKYNPKNNRAILRVPSEYYVKLHSALTLCGNYEGRSAAYRIHKASDSLIALCGDSRTYIHC